MCWGRNEEGQLGDGTTTNRLSAVAVVGVSDATAVSSGTFHTCARRSGGTLSCWGQNGYGQLGDGGHASTGTPQSMASMTDIPKPSKREYCR